MKVNGLNESHISVTKDVKNIGKNFLNKMAKKYRDCLHFFTEIFLTNGSFGLPRICTFILGCAIGFSKKSRLTRGSPFKKYVEKRLEKFEIF